MDTRRGGGNLRRGFTKMISYGSQSHGTAMSHLVRSHQLGEGQSINTGMSGVVHPSRLVYGSQGSGAAMPMRDRSQGKGQRINTLMSQRRHPSPPVYGSRNHNAAMPMEKRSHLFTRGRTSFAEMPRITRLSREGAPRTRRNATETTPFPTSFGPHIDRSNAI
jgi:hypothetical protein